MARDAEPRARSRARGPSRPGRRTSTPESIGELLPRLLDEVGLGATARAGAVIRAWDEAVGPEFARHVRPDGVRNGVVHARVRDSSWMHSLQLEKPAIFARLRALLGDAAPREMRLRIGPVE